MKTGVPREVKDNEFRVAITPVGVHELTARGHDVYVERGAGVGSSIADVDYVGAGAKLVDAEIDLVLKVKELVAEEYHRMREG